MSPINENAAPAPTGGTMTAQNETASDAMAKHDEGSAAMAAEDHGEGIANSTMTTRDEEAANDAAEGRNERATTTTMGYDESSAVDAAPATLSREAGVENAPADADPHEGRQNHLPQFRDIELISDGWIKKYLLTYEMPDGSSYQYESVSRKGLDDYRAQLLGNAAGQTPVPDAVCIVPVLPDDSLLLIREFRYPVNAQVIAFPAGLIEPGETLAACVDRELREETGYRLRRSFDRDPLMPLPQSGYSSVGMAEENVRVVIAYVEPDGDAQPGSSEFIDQFTLTRDQVGPFLDTNRELIGTRCQLLLEAVRRTNVLRKRLALAQNPLRSEDFA